MAIENCTDCSAGAANNCVMWPALPVPWFGNIEDKQVVVATVGLNPSWSEFVTEGRIQRDAEKRLPMLNDVGAKLRQEISEKQSNQIAQARKEYFSTGKRSPHPWFKALQGVMIAGKLNGSYVNGTAVHLDLVACATWIEWNSLQRHEKEVLVLNCFPKFADTLSKLPSRVLLLLDGRTVFETVKLRCGGTVCDQETIGKNPVLEVWRGVLPAKFGGHDFLAWSNPINRQKNQKPLVDWLRQQAR